MLFLLFFLALASGEFFHFFFLVLFFLLSLKWKGKKKLFFLFSVQRKESKDKMVSSRKMRVAVLCLGE